MQVQGFPRKKVEKKDTSEQNKITDFDQVSKNFIEQKDIYNEL